MYPYPVASWMDVGAHTRKLMTILAQAKTASTGELTKLLGRRHPQSTTASLRTLEQRGWVEKTGRLWRVTEAGAAAVLHPQVRYVPAHDPTKDDARAAVLSALSDEPRLASEIAELSGVERTNVYQHLKRFERDRLAVREADYPTRWRQRRTDAPPLG